MRVNDQELISVLCSLRPWLRERCHLLLVCVCPLPLTEYRLMNRDSYQSTWPEACLQGDSMVECVPAPGAGEAEVVGRISGALGPASPA